MSSKRLRLLGAVPTAVVLGAVLWFTVPLAFGGSTKTTQAFCSPGQQPTHPLEMNQVTAGQLAKTIVMEKEIFNCYASNEQFEGIRDVETFLEINETIANDQVTTTVRRAENYTCFKDFIKGTVECGTRVIPITSVTASPIQGCNPSPNIPQPEDPVEMSTNIVNGYPKTVKVEKELLDCAGNIGELFLFTEIVEKASTNPSGQPTYVPIKRAFDGILCLKTQQGRIDKCLQFGPTRVPIE